MLLGQNTLLVSSPIVVKDWAGSCVRKAGDLVRSFDVSPMLLFEAVDLKLRDHSREIIHASIDDDIVSIENRHVVSSGGHDVVSDLHQRDFIEPCVEFDELVGASSHVRGDLDGAPEDVQILIVCESGVAESFGDDVCILRLHCGVQVGPGDFIRERLEIDEKSTHLVGAFTIKSSDQIASLPDKI